MKLWQKLLIGWKVLAFTLLMPAAAAAPPGDQAPGSAWVSRRFKVTAYCSCAKCCGRHSPQRGGKGLTALGVSPIPFRTVAVGDPALLGRWLWFDDLGGWVYASDTGTSCKSRAARRLGCVGVDQIDVFFGGPEWHRHAARFGVMEWTGRYLARDFSAEGGENGTR